MKFSSFVIAVCIIAALYCIGFLFFPVAFTDHYGVHLDAGGASIGRLFGAALGGYAICFWPFRNESPASVAGRAFLRSSIFFNLASLVISLNSIFTNVVTSMAWTSVIVHVLIILVSIYFLSAKKESA